MQRQAVEGEQTKTGMQKETVSFQCWAGNSVVRRMARAERTQPPEVCSSQLPGPLNQSNNDVVVSCLHCSLALAPPRRQRPATPYTASPARIARYWHWALPSVPLGTHPARW